MRKIAFAPIFGVLVIATSATLDAQQASQGQPAPAVSPSYTAHRVYDTKRRRFIDLESLTRVIARDADVAYLGEFHNDPGTHQLQRAILEGVARRRDDRIVLSLEMFERDVQGQLDAYLAGTIDEPTFLASSRPWGNYVADYRPLVEFAKAKGWPVVGGNVPRRLASTVARRGLAALDSLPAPDRPFVAAQHSCPRNAYWERFRETMGDMSGHGMTLSPDQVQQMVWRTYEAQCVKDEAMAEAIVAARETHRTLIVHANGAFHSDFHLGTVERVKRRAPRLRQVVVSFVPVSDLDAVNGRARRRQGDYIVFTLAPAPATPAAAASAEASAGASAAASTATPAPTASRPGGSR
jgi:uncharacterized iron-regulated protein